MDAAGASTSTSTSAIVGATAGGVGNATLEMLSPGDAGGASSSAGASGGQAEGEAEGMSSTTLLLLSFGGTVVPLACAAAAFLALRRCWNKMRRGYQGDLQQEQRRRRSSAPAGHDARATSLAGSPDSSRHARLLDGAGGARIMPSSTTDVVPTLSASVGTTGVGGVTMGLPMVANHNSSCRRGPDGSLITMTLENNHLIVETEQPTILYADASDADAADAADVATSSELLQSSDGGDSHSPHAISTTE